MPGTDLRIDLFELAKAARDPKKLPLGMELGLAVEVNTDEVETTTGVNVSNVTV